MDLTCAQCGNPLADSPHRGRPQTKFCSRGCRDKFYLATSRAETQQKRAEQRCRQCGGPIALNAGSRAQTCSRKCGDAWQNAKRQEAKRAEWRATNPVCRRCGDPIPESRFRNSLYCSAKCKKREMDERWRASSPGYNRLYNYGVTPERWDAQMDAQDGRCAICRSDEWPAPGRNNKGHPHLDHDHLTGVFRGILCGNCNLGMGHFGHDPARLRAAADYLEKFTITV